jgi:Flp pilus assembly protein TadD
MLKNEDFENAMSKVNKNDFAGAIIDFNLAITAEPANTDFLYNRAVAYLNLEKTELAIFDFSRLIEIDNTNAFYFSCRGFAKARTSDKKGAIKDYEKALELDPDNPITYNNMGLVQEELGWMNQAKDSFSQSDDLRSKEEGKFGNIKEAPVSNFIETDEPEIQLTKGEVAKNVFTKKGTFKEFVSFIRNGFKLK